MADTEKITLNVSAADPGKIDHLVRKTLYSNRADFICTAVCSPVDKHTLEIRQNFTCRPCLIGALSRSRSDLAPYRAAGTKKMTVTGLPCLNNNITLEPACEPVESIQVRGVFQAREAVKAALANRIR